VKEAGIRIKQMREDRGWTQEELAKMVGSGEKYISDLERGKRKPGPKLVLELCNAFCISEQEMRFGSPNEHGLDRRHSVVLRMLVDELSLLSETERLEELARLRRVRESK
jgi:transcriptional regulator with XRE-family HTH domain